MADYTATVTSPRPAEEVFAYLADFRTVQEWDPSITGSEYLNGDDDPIKVGALYRVTTSTKLKDVVLEYETTEIDRPYRIVLVGENDTTTSTDTITIVEQPDGGCEVTYAAELELKGARKLVDPLLDLGFQRVGDKAKAGLAEKLQLRD